MNYYINSIDNLRAFSITIISLRQFHFYFTGMAVFTSFIYGGCTIYTRVIPRNAATAASFRRRQSIQLIFQRASNRKKE